MLSVVEMESACHQILVLVILIILGPIVRMLYALERIALMLMHVVDMAPAFLQTLAAAYLDTMARLVMSTTAIISLRVTAPCVQPMGYVPRQMYAAVRLVIQGLIVRHRFVLDLTLEILLSARATGIV